jgi:uncharacterized membrane protein YGL010W
MCALVSWPKSRGPRGRRSRVRRRHDAGRTVWDDWIARYAQSHQHPVNRVCHTLGIPLIVVSLPLFLVAALAPGFWPIPLALFIVGWVFQFIGHAFEGKPPEFFHDWRFLFVGLRWWVAKVSGRV